MIEDIFSENNWDIEEVSFDNYFIIVSTGFNSHAGVIVEYKGDIVIRLLYADNKYRLDLFSDYNMNFNPMKIYISSRHYTTIEKLKKIGNVLILGKDITKKDLIDYVCEDKEFLEKIKNKKFLENNLI